MTFNYHPISYLHLRPCKATIIVDKKVSKPFLCRVQMFFFILYLECDADAQLEYCILYLFTGNDGLTSTFFRQECRFCVCVLSSSHGEAAHVLRQPWVKFWVCHLFGFDQISRLGSPALCPLSLYLTLHFPPSLGTKSRLVDLPGEEEEEEHP